VAEVEERGEQAERAEHQRDGGTPGQQRTIAGGGTEAGQLAGVQRQEQALADAEQGGQENDGKRGMHV